MTTSSLIGVWVSIIPTHSGPLSSDFTTVTVLTSALLSALIKTRVDIAVADIWKQIVCSFRTVYWLFEKSLTTAWPFFDGILGTSSSHFGDGINYPHDANDFFCATRGRGVP